MTPGLGWSWLAGLHEFCVLAMVPVLLLWTPILLVRTDDAVQRRAARTILVAGWLAWLLGMLAAVGKGVEGWDKLVILGPRYHAGDIGWVLMDAGAPAALGCLALAWCAFLVVLVGLRERVDKVLLAGAAILLPVAAAVLAATADPMPAGVHPGLEEKIRRMREMGAVVHYQHPPGAFVGALVPLCWILAPAGALIGAAAIRRWRRSRAAGDVAGAQEARRTLTESGVLVLSASAVWTVACAREVFGPLVVLGPRYVSVDSLRHDFALAAALPCVLAAGGMLAAVFGSLHLRAVKSQDPKQ